MAKAIAPDVDPLGPLGYGSTAAESPETSTGSAGTSTGSAGATTAEMEEGGLNDAVAFDPVKQAQLMTHLHDKLPAFEFTTVPLGQFVAFLSLASTVPMVIDTQSLVEAGKSDKMRISVKLDGATVEESLKAALDKPGLTFHVEPGRVVITSRSAKSKWRGCFFADTRAAFLAAATARPGGMTRWWRIHKYVGRTRAGIVWPRPRVPRSSVDGQMSASGAVGGCCLQQGVRG